MDDGLFYTVRYYSYDQGQYQYMNVSDQQVTLDKLQADTDYYFEVRSMSPPYLSEWSDQARNRTRGRISFHEVTKAYAMNCNYKGCKIDNFLMEKK